MAELNYEDVRRAVQDTLNLYLGSQNEVRGNFQSLSNDISRQGDLLNQIIANQRPLNEIQQNLQRINTSLQALQTNIAASQQVSQSIVNEMHRLAEIQQFMANVGDYINRVQNQLIVLQASYNDFQNQRFAAEEG